MTLKELSQLYHLNQEIEREKNRLLELESLATNISAQISGMPFVGAISDKTAIAAQIADCRIAIDGKIKQSVAEYNRLIRYINTIDDSLTRQVFVLRFIDGLSWMDVAEQIGGNCTDYAVKQICYRYLQSH